MASLFSTVRGELSQAAERVEDRALDVVLAALERLVERKRQKFGRVLPLGDYLVDRWDKARLLGFGEGTSVYDSCLVIGEPKVGKNCWIGPYTVLDGSGGLELGDEVTLSADVHVYTHDSVRTTIDGAPVARSPVKIGSKVYVGPNSVIARGVTIGDRVIVGACSLVLADVPAGTKVAGSPARVLGSVDS